ncbi:hypothetical protein [Rhizobacter sp. P5_C2]
MQKVSDRPIHQRAHSEPPKSPFRERTADLRKAAKRLNSHIGYAFLSGNTHKANALLHSQGDFDDVEKFSYLLQPSTRDMLKSTLGSDGVVEIKAFQCFLRGERREWRDVAAFAKQWATKWKYPDGRKDLQKFSWAEHLNKAVQAFQRISEPQKNNEQLSFVWAEEVELETSSRELPVDSLEDEVRLRLENASASEAGVVDLSDISCTDRHAPDIMAQQVYLFSISHPDAKLKIKLSGEFRAGLCLYFKLPPVDGKKFSKEEKIDQAWRPAYFAGAAERGRGGRWRPRSLSSEADSETRKRKFANLAGVAKDLAVSAPQNAGPVVKFLIDVCKRTEVKGEIEDMGRSLSDVYDLYGGTLALQKRNDGLSEEREDIASMLQHVIENSDYSARYGDATIENSWVRLEKLRGAMLGNHGWEVLNPAMTDDLTLRKQQFDSLCRLTGYYIHFQPDNAKRLIRALYTRCNAEKDPGAMRNIHSTLKASCELVENWSLQEAGKGNPKYGRDRKKIVKNLNDFLKKSDFSKKVNKALRH